MTGLKNPRSRRRLFPYLFAACAVLLGIVFVGGRFSGGRSEPSSGSLALPEGKWPENRYTAGLPKPDKGKFTRGWIDPDRQYCYLELTGFGPSESERYISALKDAGYSEVKRVSEKTDEDHRSTAVNLSRGDAGLSISYLDGLFCMYIYRPEQGGP